jgi:DNA (cytosine-5)-methyltransferase 1
VRTWPLFWTWWAAMEQLGYVGQLVSLNSMFALPTPQSRDRIYVVWTRKGNRRPDLAIAPLAPCVKCGDVEARQTWKTGRSVGKYGPRNQYVYTCPRCRAVVTPYYFCALNALDFSIPATRIGDRKVPLRARTIERVRYGLEKYGRRALQVTTNNVSGISCRVRGVADPLFGQTTSNTTAVVAPFLVNDQMSRRVYPADAPLATQTASRAHDGLAFTPFMVTNRTHNNGQALDRAVPAVCTGYHHALVQPAALVRLLGDRPVSPLDAPAPTQTTGAAQNLLVSPAPFLVQYYGTGTATSADEPVPAVPTRDRNGVVDPRSLEVEDCYFRMMTPPEIGAAMAFPGTYTVLGTNGQRIKQYGNAVTPPAMALLIERVVQSITGERAA